MTNTNNFFDKEPAAIETIVSRKNNLVYEILLISYVEDHKDKHGLLLFYFHNACHMTKCNNNEIGTSNNKDIMSIYSGKEPSGEITVSDKNGKSLYKMILVSHAKNESAIVKHQERFRKTSFITSNFLEGLCCNIPYIIKNSKNAEMIINERWKNK